MAARLRRYYALLLKEVQQLKRNRGLVIQLMLPPTIVLVNFWLRPEPQGPPSAAGRGG